MNDFIKYAILAVVIIVATAFVQYYMNKANRYNDNQNQLLYNFNKVIKLNNSEFKKYIQENDKELLRRVSDSLKMKIRPQNVTKYNNTSYYYKDTNIVEIPLIEVADKVEFSHRDSCFAISGIVDVVSNKVIITNRELKDNIIKLNYVKRKPIKWLFGLRIGKKEAGVYIESNCGKTQNIEVLVD